MTQQLARSGYRKGDAPSVPIAPKFLARGGGGWAPSLLGGSWGRGRGAGAPSPSGRGEEQARGLAATWLPPRRPLVGCAGGSDGNRARGPLATQVSPARGLQLHRVPLSHGPARHPLPLAPPPQLRCTFPSPEEPSLHPGPVLRALLSPRGYKKREREKQADAAQSGAQDGKVRARGLTLPSAVPSAAAKKPRPGSPNPAGGQVKRFGPDGVGDRDRDRTDARVGSARVALALRSGRGSARLGSRLPSGSLAPTLGSHMTPAPLALRASPGLAG